MQHPYGHGHNYVVEVSMSETSTRTAMIANLADLDAFVERQCSKEFDHKSLNEDVPHSEKKYLPREFVHRSFRRLKFFPRRNSSASASKRRETTASNTRGKPRGNARDQATEEILLNEQEPKEIDARGIACTCARSSSSSEKTRIARLRKTPERFEKALKYLTSATTRTWTMS